MTDIDPYSYGPTAAPLPHLTFTGRFPVEDYLGPAHQILDPNASSHANAAWSWAQRGDRAHMLDSIHKLDRVQVLATWRAANRLVEALAEHHGVLTKDGAS